MKKNEQLKELRKILKKEMTLMELTCELQDIFEYDICDHVSYEEMLGYYEGRFLMDHEGSVVMTSKDKDKWNDFIEINTIFDVISYDFEDFGESKIKIKEVCLV